MHLKTLSSHLFCAPSLHGGIIVSPMAELRTGGGGAAGPGVNLMAKRRRRENEQKEQKEGGGGRGQDEKYERSEKVPRNPKM